MRVGGEFHDPLPKSPSHSGNGSLPPCGGGEDTGHPSPAQSSSGLIPAAPSAHHTRAQLPSGCGRHRLLRCLHGQGSADRDRGGHLLAAGPAVTVQEPEGWGTSPLALSRGVREGARCPEQLPLWRGPEPYAGKHGVDVSWRAVCVHRRHQDGPAGIRCRGKEQREGNNGSFSPYREAVGFPCSRYGQHSSLQHGLERLEWTGTTTPMAATAQGTLMWDIQNLMGSAQQIHPPHCSLMCLI